MYHLTAKGLRWILVLFPLVLGIVFSSLVLASRHSKTFGKIEDRFTPGYARPPPSGMLHSLDPKGMLVVLGE